MNGDGLQDIVLMRRGDIVYWPGGGYGSFGVGPRQCASSEVGANWHVPMGDSPFFSDLNLVATKIADVNGDNLADLIEVMADSVRIWINPNGQAFTAPILMQRTPQFATFSNRIRSADMNGSGSRDLVWGDAGSYRYIDFTGGQRSRLLEQIDNGLGKTTTIVWQSTTEHRQGLGWQQQTPFPVQVVSHVTVSDNMNEVGMSEGIYETAYQKT